MSILLSQKILELPADRKVTIKGGDAWICCPYHSGGFERTPSCKITLNGQHAGVFYCFGCHEKGHYNQIADKFKVSRLDGDGPSGATSMLFDFRKMKSQNDQEVFEPEMTFDWNPKVSWRGIDGQVVSDFSGKVFEYRNADKVTENRLYLPVFLDKETIVGSITALCRDPLRDRSGSKIEKSYINSKGHWRGNSLYGYHLACMKKYAGKPLVLVEGPRDTMHTYATGHRVCGVLGSALTENQSDLIRLMDDVPFIIAATDGGEAGNHAAESIRDLLQPDLKVVRLKFPEDKDPCDYSVDKLRNQLDKMTKRFMNRETA